MDSGWGFQSGDRKDSIPLGKDAERFLMENPQWVLYFRKDRRFVCRSCWDSASQSPGADRLYCADCFGFGWKTTPMIVPSRVQLGPAQGAFMEGDIRYAPGYVEQYMAVVDFPRCVAPQLEDVVCVCEWSKPTQKLGQYPRARVLSIQSIYEIKQINDHFERELGWYNCAMKAYSIDKHHVERWLGVLVDVDILSKDKLWTNTPFW